MVEQGGVVLECPEEILHDAVWDRNHISEWILHQYIVVMETSFNLNVIIMSLKPTVITYY